MNREKFRDNLVESALEVLGEGASICAEVVYELPDMAGRALAVQMDFGGPEGERGIVLLKTSERCGAEIVSHLLGYELKELKNESQIQGGMCEILNMIVGAATNRWFGREAVCHIGIPRPANPSAALRGGLMVDVVLRTETAQGIKLSAALGRAPAQPA